MWAQSFFVRNNHTPGPEGLFIRPLWYQANLSNPAREDQDRRHDHDCPYSREDAQDDVGKARPGKDGDDEGISAENPAAVT
jgi:hypothetical protein